jgi:hypothetical protein
MPQLLPMTSLFFWGLGDIYIAWVWLMLNFMKSDKVAGDQSEAIGSKYHMFTDTSVHTF